MELGVPFLAELRLDVVTDEYRAGDDDDGKLCPDAGQRDQGLVCPLQLLHGCTVWGRDVEEAPHASLPDDLDVLALNLSGITIWDADGGLPNPIGSRAVRMVEGVDAFPVWRDHALRNQEHQDARSYW